jgi:hypothetical protein
MVPGMNEPPNRYDVTVTVAREAATFSIRPSLPRSRASRIEQAMPFSLLAG